MGDGSHVTITNTADAVKELETAQAGEHGMLVYRHLNSFRKIYSKFARQRLTEANDMVVLFPFYEHPNSVRQYLSKYGGIDVSRQEKNGALIIVDSMQAHFRNNVPVMSYLETLAGLARSSGRNGVSLIADMGPYFHVYHPLGRLGELVKFEKSLPPRFDTELRTFCCYHRLNYDMLTNDQKQALREHHSRQLMLAEAENTAGTATVA